MKLQR